jgi:ubiquinone biosynthesis protein COQ4
MEQRASQYPSLPPNASLFTRLRVGVLSVRVLMRNPAEPVYGMLFQDALDGGKLAAMARGFANLPAGRRLLEQRPELCRGHVDLEALAKLPPGTLGREFARFYEGNPGVEPIFTLPREMSDGQYLGKRMRESHDLHHLLTGYGTDMMGEMELQAFQLGNLGTPTSLFAVLAGWSNEQVTVPKREYLRRIRTAYQRGRSSPEMASVLWEDHWTTPLEQLRARFFATRAV